MQKHVNSVDLVKSFPTNIYLQNLASIQKRTSPLKFAHLAEESDKGSVSNLSTKVRDAEGEQSRRCIPRSAASLTRSSQTPASSAAQEEIEVEIELHTYLALPFVQLARQPLRAQSCQVFRTAELLVLSVEFSH